jgi:hypothetical protein
MFYNDFFHSPAFKARATDKSNQIKYGSPLHKQLPQLP